MCASDSDSDSKDDFDIEDYYQDNSDSSSF